MSLGNVKTFEEIHGQVMTMHRWQDTLSDPMNQKINWATKSKPNDHSIKGTIPETNQTSQQTTNYSPRPPLVPKELVLVGLLRQAVPATRGLSKS
uniref:Uncharacterized protein n=1 Tax=Romanomermis culicivorax TaxID=13658 RepID=A0A915KGF7_ROMCU